MITSSKMTTINLGIILGIVIGLVFTLLVIDNLFLRRKIFKLYERLAFEREKKASYREYLPKDTTTIKK